MPIFLLKKLKICDLKKKKKKKKSKLYNFTKICDAILNFSKISHLSDHNSFHCPWHKSLHIWKGPDDPKPKAGLPSKWLNAIKTNTQLKFIQNYQFSSNWKGIKALVVTMFFSRAILFPSEIFRKWSWWWWRWFKVHIINF